MKLPIALFCAASIMAVAQTPATGKIGVIQLQAALLNTKDGQKAMADFQSRLEPKKKEFERQQNDIRELQEKLQKGGNAMAESARNELAYSIDQKTKNLNRDTQDASEDAEQEQRKVLSDLFQKMLPVISKYAQANGYSVILDSSAQTSPVLFAIEGANITKEIVDAYDKESGAPGPSQPAGSAPGTAAPKPAPAKTGQ